MSFPKFQRNIFLIDMARNAPKLHSGMHSGMCESDTLPTLTQRALCTKV